jgi:UTP--glucose-1-phosphate uridylyltransferase
MIGKAVIPAAGRGTRVAGIRGGRPKECLEVVGVPMIGLALVEMALSGIDEVCVVVSPEKGELIRLLDAPGPFPDQRWIERLYPRGIADGARLSWPRIVRREQPEPRGVVEAVSRARDYLEGQPFALVMPDNLLSGDGPVTFDLARTHARQGGAVMGLIRITREEALRVGNVGGVEVGEPVGPVVPIRWLQDKRRGTFEIPLERREVIRAVGRSIMPAAFADLDPDELARTEGEIDDVPRFQQLALEGRLHGRFLQATLHDLGQESGIRAARALLGD